MTTHGPATDNVLLSASRTSSLAIEVDEFPLARPSAECRRDALRGVMELIKNHEIGPDRLRWEVKSMEVEAKRPRNGDARAGQKAASFAPRQRRSSYGSLPRHATVPQSSFGERRSRMQRPSLRSFRFECLVAEDPVSAETGTRCLQCGRLSPTSATLTQNRPLPPLQHGPRHLSPRPHPAHTSCGVALPLTPPEDIDSFSWNVLPAPDEAVYTVPSSGEENTRARPPRNQSRGGSSSRPSEIQMPDLSRMASESPSRSTWLGRVCQHLVSHITDLGSHPHIQMVVQALPSQCRSASEKLVFEEVVETIQTRFSLAPYITITHAVSQVISMDEVPASPPATPNPTHPSDDYFQDQTIFTHAALVPSYHRPPPPGPVLSPRPTHIIAAPSSIHITTLERYIPPTSVQESTDFFTLSRRSYLVDRLLELSVNHGSMLLIYPTRAGAATFATKYLGPVMEPFLRRFVLLNDLSMDLASSMGKMAALPAMKTFDEMEMLVRAICQALGERAPVRGLLSKYDIVHAEAAEVVLERSMWMEWFLEQESPRLRQSLVDYHKAGGRMPSRRGQVEVTTGMLAREAVDGIRRSRQEAGNVGMEVAVFVIRRSVL